MQAGEAAAASEAPSALDVENKAILVALNEADQYYQEQQRFGKTIRKGFLDLAKARQAVGPSNAISLGWTSRANRTPSSWNRSRIGVHRSATSWKPASMSSGRFGGHE